MGKLLSICKNTFVQTIRQPIFCILLMVMFFVLVMALPLTNWTMSIDYHEANQKLLEGLGLSTLLMMGLLVAAFSASGVLAREIEDKTALTVISKPVSRATFVAGKFLGVAGAVTLFYYLGSMAYLMTIRHKVMPASADPYDWPVIILGGSALLIAFIIAVSGNVTFSWTFTSTIVLSATITMSLAIALISFIGKGWRIVEFGDGLGTRLLLALVLMYMAVLIFTAVAIAASTRLGQVATLLVCCAVFFVGSIHSFLFGYWNDRIVLAGSVGWLLPNLDYFQTTPIDALQMDKPMPIPFVATAAVYCACFVAAVLALAIVLFQRRQLTGQKTSASMPGSVDLLAWTGRIIAVVLVLIGIEGVLSFIAAGASESFSPVAMRWLKDIFLSVGSPDAMVLLPAIGLIIAGAAGWMMWGFFGRGAPWSYWIACLLTILCLISTPLTAIGIVPAKLETGPNRDILLAIRAVVSAAVLVILWLRKTRRHFNLVRGA